ncbi:uncharacterized protein LOC143923399 [Lithobates pipiens]
MSQGNVGGTLPPNTTTGNSSSDGAYGPSTTKPTTARENDPARRATQFFQKLKPNNNVYSLDRLGIKRRGDSEDPTVNTIPAGSIKYLNKDHQPDKSSELQGRKEQRPRANITQTSLESFVNMGNIHILPRNGQMITPGENENCTTEEFPLVEEHQKSSDVNNAITTAAAHSHEPKESSLQLQVKIKPARPPPPPPQDRVILPDNHMNPTQMATVDPFIDTEDSPPNHSLQSSCPEEKQMSIMREIPLVEAHLESRDMNNGTTSGASHSQEPKESSQQLPEKKKPKIAKKPPPPPKRVTSINKYINVPLMDVGDTSKGTEDITPKQSLRSLSLEEMENSTTRKFPLVEAHLESRDMNYGTTSEASHSQEPKDSSQQLPEMAKPRTALRNPPPPPPLHPPENVTPRDTFMNAAQVVNDDKSIEVEDIVSKQSLLSCTEETENSTKIKIPLVEAHQSRDANNASTTGGANLNEPKESSQKEKPKVPSRAPPPIPPVRGAPKDKLMNTIPTAKGDTSRIDNGPPKHTLQPSSHGPKGSPPHLGKTKPPRPLKPPVKRTTSAEKPLTATQMVIGVPWRGTEDSHPKHTLQPSSFDASRVLVLSWDLVHEASSVSSYLMGYQNRDCPCVVLSSLKKDSEWTSLVDQSSIVIFYTTPKSQKPLHKMGRYLEYCVSKKGAEKVIAVIVDANNLEEDWTTKWEENKFSKIQQLQISRAERGWINRNEMPRIIEEIRKSLIIHTDPAVDAVKEKKDTLDTLKRKLTNRSKKGYRPPIYNIDNSDLDRFVHLSISSTTLTQISTHNKEECTPSSSNPVPPEIEPSQRGVVGIFSRSSTDDYSWLVELLTSEYFRDCIQEVRHCYISSNGFQQFMNDLSQCTFGILYHTKNRGRINITDVTSSLYDEELEYLNRTLGMDNVLVVVDDLEDSSDQEKTRILENQPSIGKLAGDLLLISHTEKADNMQLVRKLKSIKHACHSSENFSKRRLQGQEQKALPTNSQKTPTSQRSAIGVFTVSEEGHISWLRRLLSSDIFGQREVTYHEMPSYDDVGLEEGQIQCVAAILYHTTKNGSAVTPQGEFLYRRVTEQLVHTLGKDNVIVLIDDLQSVADRKWVLWIKSKIEKWAGDLLYITPEEKYYKERLVQRLKSLKLFRQPPEYRTRTDPVQHKLLGKSSIQSAPASSVIGIFSRSEKSKCSWLERLLSSKEFGNHQVVFHQISPGNLKEFQSLVSLCKFGILYHCMGRGYQYLTDQKTSLYDEELLYLSTRIGKSRVIVVIDEVGNSDKEAKSWTVESQPSLEMLARDVLLFTKSDNILQQNRNRSMHVDRRLSTVYEKLNTLKEILKEGMTSASFSNSKEDLV